MPTLSGAPGDSYPVLLLRRVLLPITWIYRILFQNLDCHILGF